MPQPDLEWAGILVYVIGALIVMGAGTLVNRVGRNKRGADRH
jgi:hypothetical protein